MLGGLPGPMADYFGSIPTAMTTLFYVGTLADGIWDIWKDVWQVGTDGNPAGYIFLFVFFYVFSNSEVERFFLTSDFSSFFFQTFRKSFPEHFKIIPCEL